jgi:hypothetical protein
MYLLENFQGYVKGLHLWEKAIPLPFNPEDYHYSAKAAYTFSEENFNDGWQSITSYGFSQNISATLNNGFKFNLVRIPKPLDIENVSTIGQIHATETLFDGVGCKNNEQFDLYGGLVLNGEGAVLELEASWKTTNSLTIELWFRFPNIKIDGPNPMITTESIYLFSMTGD